MLFEETYERFCKVKNKNVIFSVKLTIIPLLGGKCAIQGTGCICSDKECHVKTCQLIKSENELIVQRIMSEYEDLHKDD